jgi:hypothetical protein
LNGRIATRCYNALSDSERDFTRVSLYPMAQWLAASWWRLRWEPDSSETASRPPANWGLSHDLAASGHGFLWPNLTFASDGEWMQLHVRPSSRQSQEPTRYLSEFSVSIPIQDFETSIDQFLEKILLRLEPLGNTDLHDLWREILHERHIPELTRLRQAEASLGFDPDEAPAATIQRFLDLGAQIGDRASKEMMPACAGGDPATNLDKILALSRQSGILGKPQVPPAPLDSTNAEQPFERANCLARSLRNDLGIPLEPIRDSVLTDVLGIPSESLAKPPAASSIGLATKAEKKDNLNFYFRKNNYPGRRFEAARFVADYLFAHPSDRWLPLTDAVTVRQKLQRAFAIEFLCPIESLERHLNGATHQDALDDAAEHYGISPFAIKSHLQNHRLIQREPTFTNFQNFLPQ